MIISVAFAEKKFDEFNRLIFGGGLPRVPIELCDVKSFFGECVCRKRRVSLGRIECYDYRLRFNRRADLPERDLEDVIIHEMIHYYIGINNLRDTSAHGPLFRSLMNKINERFGRHVTVSRKIAEADKEHFLKVKREW
ncbi:MAG: SprT-like domain-containing protein, partial [Bacteroidaceae bacterium]